MHPPLTLVVGTLESLVVYGMLAYFAGLTLRSQSTRAVSVGGVALIVILIAFSRVYLGAHYVGDVAGGFAAGRRIVGRRHHGMGGYAPA
jgi:membrane-associated phospholipid phosphatase